MGSFAASANTSFLLGSNTPVPSGTANGVLYLDGSKVVTSGTALTFNGTNLSLTAAGGAYFYTPNVVNGGGIFDAGGNNGMFIFGNIGGSNLRFLASGAEQMRLNSTGLGIGTNNPQGKLQVNGTLLVGGQTAVRNTGVLGIGQQQIETNSYSALQMFGNTNSVDGSYIGLFKSRSGTIGGVTAVQQNDVLGGVFFGGADGTTMQSSASIDVRVDGPVASGVIPGRFVFSSTNTSGVYGTRMTLDSSGNLGLGVTPSAWSTGVAIQTRGAGIWDNGVNNTYFVQNGFFNGTNWIYRNSFASSQYLQINGSHQWFTAPSGTAGNAISFTQALTLDAAGKLLVGLTSSRSTNALLQVNAPVNLQGYTVATLPAGTVGDTAYVTDATAPTFLGALIGGGAVKCPVFHNGTAWVAC